MNCARWRIALLPLLLVALAAPAQEPVPPERRDGTTGLPSGKRPHGKGSKGTDPSTGLPSGRRDRD